MYKLKQIMKDNRGFTLIELMIVLVVLGILSGIAIPRISDIRDDSRISAAQSELSSLRGQFTSYYAKNGNWPDNPQNEGRALGQLWEDMSEKYDGLEYTRSDDNLDGAEFGVALRVKGEGKADWFMSDQGISDNYDEIGLSWNPDL